MSCGLFLVCHLKFVTSHLSSFSPPTYPDPDLGDQGVGGVCRVITEGHVLPSTKKCPSPASLKECPSFPLSRSPTTPFGRLELPE